MLSTMPNCHSLPCEEYGARLRQVCGAFEIDAGQSRLKGFVDQKSRAGLDFAYVGQDARAIRRTDKHIKSDPGSHFFMVLQLGGAALMQQEGKAVKLLPGDMFIVDSTRPSTFTYRGELSSQLSLHLPRDEARHRFGGRIKGGMAIAGRDPLAQAVRSILAELLEGEMPRQGHVAEALYGVLGAYFFNRSLGEAGEVSAERRIVSRAMQIMAIHHSDADFTTTHLANLTGVSLRNLQRAFAQLGASPHQRLQDVRLDAACEMMDRACPKTGSIASVAFDCGFSDLSTFYRQFKKRYGCAPGDRRAMQGTLALSAKTRRLTSF